MKELQGAESLDGPMIRVDMKHHVRRNETQDGKLDGLKSGIKTGRLLEVYQHRAR